MAAHELLVDSARDGRKIKPAALLRHASMEYHLEQQVSELVAQLGRICALDRVRDLISLLDRIRGDRGEGLLPVPWATALRVAQTGHELQQRGDGAFRIAHVLRVSRHEAVKREQHARGGSPDVALSVGDVT